MNKQPKVIAITQHKGGVGKTTTSINIAAALARQHKCSVLLIDLDAQANLTQSIGINATGPTIADALANNCPLPVLPLPGYGEHLHAVPASLDLAAAEAGLYGKMLGRESVLKMLLADIKQQYDFIVIDCPPSLGLLTINALTAADELIIPVQAEFMAARGLDSLLDIIKLVQAQLNTKLKILGVVVTQYAKNKIINRDTHDALRDLYGGQVFETVIRENIALAEAPANQQDIFTYSPGSNGAADYGALAKEILARTHHWAGITETETINQ